MAIPSSRSSRASADERLGGAAQRIEVGDLRSDVGVQADDLEARRGATARRQMSRTASIGDAELVGLEPGRDVRMAPGVDVRVDAQRDARARLPLARQRVDPLDLAVRLGVDGPDAEIDRLRQLGRGLADAGEDDLRGDEAGAERDVDLAARVRVGAAAEPAEQPRDRQRRVRLERVVEGVRIRPRTPRRWRGSGRRSSRRCRRRAACPRRRRGRRAARRRRRAALSCRWNPVTEK